MFSNIDMRYYEGEDADEEEWEETNKALPASLVAMIPP